MFCPKCGKDLGDTKQLICPECGADLTSAAQEQDNSGLSTDYATTGTAQKSDITTDAVPDTLKKQETSSFAIGIVSIIFVIISFFIFWWLGVAALGMSISSLVIIIRLLKSGRKTGLTMASLVLNIVAIVLAIIEIIVTIVAFYTIGIGTGV